MPTVIRCPHHAPILYKPSFSYPKYNVKVPRYPTASTATEYNDICEISENNGIISLFQGERERHKDAYTDKNPQVHSIKYSFSRKSIYLEDKMAKVYLILVAVFMALVFIGQSAASPDNGEFNDELGRFFSTLPKTFL